MVCEGVEGCLTDSVLGRKSTMLISVSSMKVLTARELVSPIARAHPRRPTEWLDCNHCAAAKRGLQRSIALPFVIASVGGYVGLHSAGVQSVERNPW